MSRRSRLRAQISQLQEQLAELEHQVPEPKADPCVVVFVKTWSGDARYTYVAFKEGDLWRLTSTNSRVMSRHGQDWDSLVDFIDEGESSPPEIIAASNFEVVRDKETD